MIVGSVRTGGREITITGLEAGLTAVRRRSVRLTTALGQASRAMMSGRSDVVDESVLGAAEMAVTITARLG